MTVKVLFFGILKDKTGAASAIVEGMHDLNELKQHLDAKYPSITNQPYLIAVNQQITKGNLALNDQDEIAFMPPFAGG